MRVPTIIPVLILYVLLCGCSAIEYNSTNSPKMVVVVERTPFYHNGPAQGNGPDMSLLKGDEVRVIRKEIGYSFVLLEDGQGGYIANDDLRPAPPEADVPKAKATPRSSAAAGSTNSTTSPPFRY